MEKEELQRYMQVIYRRCYRILRREELAWDALQDIFAAYCEANRKETIQEPLRFLYKICTNHCLNLLKYHKRRESVPFDERSFDTSADHVAENRLFCQQILKEFGEDALTLLIYRYVDQMTYGELAALYGLTDRGIKKRLDRIVLQIKEHYQDGLAQWMSTA